MPRHHLRATPLALAAFALSAVAAQAQDKVGIAECDEYLSKFQACVATLPDPQKQAMAPGIEQMRTSWRAAAQNEGAKAGLAAACKQATDQSKPQMTALGCKW